MGTQERHRPDSTSGGTGSEPRHDSHAGLRASAQRVGAAGDRIIDRTLSGDSEAYGRQSRQQSGQ